MEFAIKGINDLLKTLHNIEKNLEAKFPDFDLVIVPGVLESAAISDDDMAVLENYRQDYLTSLANSDLSENAQSAIAAKYDCFMQDIGKRGSIACMEGLEQDDVSVDFVGICLDQASGEQRLIGDGSLDLLFLTLHEIGHTIHSKYYGGHDDQRFNGPQKEVFADTFAAHYMKHELGINNAYEMIAALREKRADPAYPFYKHYRDLEQKMDGNSRLGMEAALMGLASYVEHDPRLNGSAKPDSALQQMYNLYTTHWALPNK